MTTQIWAVILYNPSPHRRPEPGPPYWFRSKEQASRFADDRYAIYPHLPQLFPVHFTVWKKGMYAFNPDTYTGKVVVLNVDHNWYAFKYAVEIDPSLPTLWTVPLNLLT